MTEHRVYEVVKSLYTDKISAGGAVLCKPIPTWEYKFIVVDLERLNELGNEGWELLAVDNEVAYLKRKL